VEDHAAFLRFQDGLLVLAARSERMAGQVRERIREADFAGMLHGFRNVEVVVEADGRTGVEARAAGDEKRRVEARAAAERSPALARVKAAFGAALETVEPLADSPAEPIFEVEESHDG
jgi:hypothetical protein